MTVGPKRLSISPNVGQRAAPLESIPPIPLELVILTPPVSSSEMAAAVLATDKRVSVGERPISDVHVNTFHVTHAHANKVL